MEEQDQRSPMAGQGQQVVEDKTSKYDFLRHFLEEANKRLKLLEAKVSESEVLRSDLLAEVDKAKGIASATNSQLEELKVGRSRLKRELSNAMANLKLT
ncbi:hypothetical protein SLA2020_269390 [Shorea laevis]